MYEFLELQCASADINVYAVRHPAAARNCVEAAHLHYEERSPNRGLESADRRCPSLPGQAGESSLAVCVAPDHQVSRAFCCSRFLGTDGQVV